MFSKKDQKKISDAYRKTGRVADRMYKVGREVLQDGSVVARKLGNTLGKVANIGDQVLSNPNTNAILGMDPHLKQAGDVARKGTQYIQVSGDLSTQASKLANEKAYSGNAKKDISSALERTKHIVDTGASAKYI